MSDSVPANPETRPPLDPALYPLDDDPEALKFVQTLTGIQDAEELKQHALQLQAKAYEIYGYTCIRTFSFLRPKLTRLPGYKRALSIVRRNPGAIFLDMGCCFGTDARKAVSDGWPVQNILSSDIQPGYWECGHELYKSTPETFPGAFIPGDVFDPALIEPHAPFYTTDEVPAQEPPVTDFRTLTSLTPLRGRISAIHTSSFFHLFTEEKQLRAARQLASLLSPEPGSVIFGCHLGQATKGPRQFPEQRQQDRPMFCHSPLSWKKEVWEGPVFKEDTVEVRAGLVEREIANFTEGGGSKMPVQILVWSVTRL